MERGIGKLVVCPTPLGNLGDMPPRALDALRSADVVCCEDTRVTGKLLAALGVKGKRLERLDEATIGASVGGLRGHVPNGEPESLASCGPATVGEAVVARVLEGETVVYCSDAGMPGVSDPGQRLVAAARDMGAPVEVLPGPTAVATAYVASGFSCPRFYFAGFFPRKAGERKTVLETCAQLDAVCIFYESPHRLAACLRAISDVLPQRRGAVCRELTKLHEEVVVDSFVRLAALFEEREAHGGVKGECVVVVDAPSEAEEHAVAQGALEQAKQAAAAMAEEGVLSKRDIADALQRDFGVSRNKARDIAYG